MRGVWSGRGERRASHGNAGIAVFMLLTASACAAPSGQARWVKSGLDDAAVTREVNDCQAQAKAAQSTQQGINQDRSATLGRNWALSYTTGLQTQNMEQQAAVTADQVFNNCMRAKGFTKAG